MTKKTNAGLILTLAACACHPMEQAPLIYTSKSQVGVTVATGTADSPGLDVNIGYKGLDSAFVPVAVAKACHSRNHSDCIDEQYRLRVINGTNDTSAEDSVASLRKDRDAAQESLNALSKERLAVEEKLGWLKTKGVREAELTQLRNPTDEAGLPRALTAEEKTRQDELSRQIAALAQLDQAALDARLATLNADIDVLKKRIGVLNERLLEEKNRRSNDNKQDALSLYGSFNSTVGGQSSGATLGLGKVFATGVAAQHLTAGINEGNAAIARQKCMEMALKTLPANPSEDQRAAARKDCGLQ